MSDAVRERLAAALAGRYRIERALGHGGMATVFLAEDLRHHRPVALKVLDPEVAATIGPERFVREIETAARLAHPHILPLFDSGSADGLLFYVMPHVAGASLRDRLARAKQLPVDEAVRITREVASALDHAHRAGVVHRDIKPENILLQDGLALVADFGIARAVAAAGAGALTATGIAVGTPAYMSPEQAAGSRDVDGRGDQYALACVLYEMLAGAPPFTGPTVESLTHQHLNLAPRPVSDLRPAVPETVVSALQRALAKTPADRYATVARFAEALTAGVGTPVGPEGTTASSPARPRPARHLRTIAFASSVAIAAVVALVWWRGGSGPGPGERPALGPLHARTEVAVLPFQNLSVEGSHAYFAGGLHEELLTQLAKVAALKVISRTSVMGYADAGKPLRQVAAELGVGSVVEGSVQVAGDRLRVNVQLIDAATDEHLWAERYDRTLDDAFAIQSDVAQRIVSAVGAALTSAEQGGLTAAPTANAEAYRLYLQAIDYLRRPGFDRQAQGNAEQLLERALALDPRFALAHAELSMVHQLVFMLRFDPSPARKERQRREATEALRLGPGLPQAHLAMALVLQGDGENAKAMEELEVALKEAPGDADLWSWKAALHRRQEEWDDVFPAYQRAVQLDPRSAQLLYDPGGTSYFATRRYAEAIREFDRALALAPDFHLAAVWRAWAYVEMQGRLDSLRVTLDRIPERAEIGGILASTTAQRATLLLWERDAPGLLRLASSATPRDFVGQGAMLHPTLYAGWAHVLAGKSAAARKAFASALAALDSSSLALAADWRLHAGRGMAMAGLGRQAEARREVDWLARCETYGHRGPFAMLLDQERAHILAQIGDADAACIGLERLLGSPSWLGAQSLRFDPRWDPIREHPRFKALLVRYANPERPS